MEGDFLPYLVLPIIFLSIIKWIYSIYRSKNFRGTSAIIARCYLLYVYISHVTRNDFIIKNKDFLITLGLAVVIGDEVLFWLSHLLGKFLRKKNTKETNHG